MDKYKDIDFNEEFKLKNEKEIEGNHYFKDEHIVKFLNITVEKVAVKKHKELSFNLYLFTI